MMDPFSEVFSLIEVQSAAAARLEVGGAWALRFPAKPYLKFNAVLRGRCWITLADGPPHRLDAGDAFLMVNAPPFILSDEPGTAAEDAAPLFARAPSNTVRHGGDDTVLIGTGFTFRDGNADLLFSTLPPLIHIPAREPAAAILRNTIELLADELGHDRMGASLMARRLADIALIQALRAYVTLHGASAADWIGALNDRQIGGALVLMHREVGRRWTVRELAASVGMSRSGFARHFRERVGRPPLEYLLRWRMQVAREALRRNQDSVAGLAAKLGYASESAFGNAFKRVFGRPPKRYWVHAVDPPAESPGTRTSATRP